MTATLEDLIARVERAHTDLNIFGAIIAICEGGTISSDSQVDEFRIIDACRRAQSKCLTRYDRAIAALKARRAALAANDDGDRK